MSEPERLDADLLRRTPLPDHPEDSDKEERGLALFIAGSRELAGAALLAGISALRAGAGKLRIATSESIATDLSVAIPEARVVAFTDNEEGCIHRDSIERLVSDCKGVSSLTVGPGMQHGETLTELISAVLDSGGDYPLILDAAALGVLPPLAERVRAWPGGAVLLPHAGEMARLLECDREKVAEDPLAAAREAAETFGAVVVIKGQWSHVVAPDGRSFRYLGGGVGLATSGSGDTLAGIVGGLCARGADPLTAALWGVYLHGEAGRTLTREVGKVGFLAREIPDQVPRLMNAF
jgi:hydroxyethylthiazole kinase-like uncharacterized protein yjeF